MMDTKATSSSSGGGKFSSVPSHFREEVSSLYDFLRFGHNRRLYVAKTTLIGCDFHGLFAGVHIKQGELVCIYTGAVLSTKEAIKQQDKSYLMRLGEQKYVDAKDHPDVLARYMNDCIIPQGHNVTFMKFADQNCANVIALCDICPGDELFVDYGKWYWAGKKPTGLLPLSDKILLQHPHEFNIKLLELNRKRLSTEILVKTQILSALFCVKYVLPPIINEISPPSDYSSEIAQILQYQPSINKDELLMLYTAYYEKLSVREQKEANRGF